MGKHQMIKTLQGDLIIRFKSRGAPKRQNLATVEDLTGLSRASIRRLVAKGEFPEPIQLAPRSVGWQYSAIQKWIEAKTNA
jgi:prophage regulatory protein